jgi:hypothetical protein
MPRSRRRVALFTGLIAGAGLIAAEALCLFAEARTDSLVGPYERGGASGEIGFSPGGTLAHEGVSTTFNDGAYVGPLRAREPPQARLESSFSETRSRSDGPSVEVRPDRGTLVHPRHISTS